MIKSRIGKVTMILVLGVILATVVLKLMLNNTTTVLVAKVDIPAGTKIDSSMYQTKSIHTDGLDPYSFKSDAEFYANDKKEGDVIANINIKKGTQLSDSNLSTPKTGNNLSAIIKPGEVAFNIPVNEVNGFSKNLNIGDMVSILATVPVQSDTGMVANDSTVTESKETIVLAENVPIRQIEKDDENKSIIGYIITLPGQTAKDLHHILSTQDDQNKRSTVRIVLDGYGNKDGSLPKTPSSDLVSRYMKQR